MRRTRRWSRSRLGIDFEAIADELLADGVRQFVEAFDTLLAAVEAKSS